MVMIKDQLTGKVKEFYAQYFKKGKLMTDTRDKKKKIREALNKELWDCPQCNKHSMEEVHFSMGSATPDGEPGLLCFHCHFMLAGEILEDYMTDEDERKE